MIRHFVSAAALLALLCSDGRLLAGPRTEIIPETTAARHGLTRPWFTQVQMDRGLGRVRYVVLHEGTLYVQTDRAMVHAIDAETGETYWARQVGRPDHPSLAPGASRDLLAVINGSRLYVCNRFNGDLLYEVQVNGAPGAGPAVSEKRAYIPMVDGMVMAYRLEPLTDPMHELGKIKKNLTEQERLQLEEERRENIRIRQEYIPPMSCQSIGRAMVQPLVTRQNQGEEYCVWPTDRGYLNIGRIDRRSEDRLAIKWRLETNAGIAAQPTYLPGDPNKPGDSGIIFAASRDGFVHAIQENGGESLWRFSTGEPILQPAVVIGQRVYVATQPGGMYCIDAKTGRELWWAPRVRQFVAASKQRVYVTDRLGRILVLHAETGGRLDTIPAAGSNIKLINSDTDRIYLGTETGLIQCLHEMELTEPLIHSARLLAARDEAPPTEQKGLDELQDQPKPPADQQPAAGEDIFGDGGDADAGENPFDDAPFDDAAGEDPFGDHGDAGDNAGDDPFGDDENPFD